MVVLCPNDYRLRDLSDVAFSAEKIIVGIRPGPAQTLYEQLKHIFVELARYTRVLLLHTEADIIDGYGYTYHLFFDFSPIFPLNPYLSRLSEARPSHLLNFKRLNGGDYFVKDRERDFYDQFHQYQKAFVDVGLVYKLYPYLAVLNNVLYLPTIKEV